MLVPDRLGRQTQRVRDRRRRSAFGQQPQDFESPRRQSRERRGLAGEPIMRQRSRDVRAEEPAAPRRLPSGARLPYEML